MGEEHNVVFGQGLKVNRAKSTLTSPSICLMRHIGGGLLGAGDTGFVMGRRYGNSFWEKLSRYGDLFTYSSNAM